MAKTKIHGAAAVVTSTIKVETIKILKKFKPNATKLVDPETKDEVFAVGFGPNPSFSSYGVVFNGQSEDGFAQVTLQIPADLDDEKKKTLVANNFGYGLLNLNKLETQIADIMEETAGEFAAINASIETL